MGDVMQYYSTCGVGESQAEDHKEAVVRRMEIDAGDKIVEQPLVNPDKIAEQIAKMQEVQNPLVGKLRVDEEEKLSREVEMKEHEDQSADHPLQRDFNM